jgi:type I restriction enzyme S subunit
MTDWPVKTLGEVCDLVNGATPDTKVKEYWGGMHAWITPAEMGGLESPFLSTSRRTLSDKGLASCSATLVPPKTVILSSRAPIGYLIINEVPMATNQGCKSLIPRDDLDFSFLYYYLKANVELLEALGTGTTFKELSGTQLKTVEIPVPPLEEQKRIVTLLDAATARVTELTACYEQARTYSNDLFTSALSDALGSNSDWPVKTLGEIGSIKGGKRLPKGTPWSSVKTAHPYIRATDIREGEVRTDNLVFVPEEIWPVISHYTVKEGDVLITIAGTIGSIAVVPKELAEANLTENAAKVTNLVDVKPSYLSCFLRSAEVRDRLESLATTTTQAKLALFRIESIEIPVPPLDEQKHIVARLDSMRAKTSEMVAAYDAKLTAAKNLRQSILEAAFTGEL